MVAKALQDTIAEMADTVEVLEHAATSVGATDHQTETAHAAQFKLLGELAARHADNYVDVGHKGRALETACRQVGGTTSYEGDNGLAASIIQDLQRLSLG